MSRTRWTMACITLVAVLAVLARPSVARAQFRRVVVRPTVVGPVVGPGFFPLPFGYFNAGSYLQGSAAVIDAQGQYLKSVQEANLLREQVRAAQVDNRRRVLEQYMFERANTLTPEEEREFRRQHELWRSWSDPPRTEIWSGQAVNNLLRAVQRGRSAHGYRGPDVPLDPELVRRLNLTSGASGSIGVFRQGEHLRWPVPLLSDTFEEDRKEIDKLARAAVQQVASGKPDAETLDRLSRANTRLRARLRENVRELSSTDYIQALRFVNQLISSTRALQDPSATRFFSDWVLTARSVGELVDQMTQKGLQFAPATLGNEAHYTSLHRALVTYASDLPLESLRELRGQFFSVNIPKAGQ
jgi:hypothetical protein